MLARLGALGPLRTLCRESSVFDLLLAQGIPLSSTLIITFVTARSLGPSGRGVLVFVVSTSSLLGAALFGSLHIGTALSQRRGELGALRTGMILAAVPIAMLALIGSLQWALSPDYTYGLLTRGRCAVICYVAGAQIGNLFVLRTLQAVGSARGYRRAITVQATLYAVGALIGLDISTTPEPVIGALIVSLLVATGYAGVKVRTHLSRQPRPTGEPARLGRLAKTSLAAHVSVIGQQLLFRADVVVLGLLGTSQQVGVYSVATPIAELMWLGSEALSLAAFAEGSIVLSDAARQGRLRQLLNLNVVLSAGAGLCIVVGTLVLLPVVLPGYRAAVPLVMILLPGVFVAGAARIVLSSMLAAGSSGVALIAGMTAVGLSTLYVPFVLVGAATGAAMASTAVYLSQASVLLYLQRRAARTLAHAK